MALFGDVEDGVDDEADGEEGHWWHVNKSGFPLDDETNDKMWDHVVKVHPKGYAIMHEIKGNPNLPKVPVPQLPNLGSLARVEEKLAAVQAYLKEFQYNHTGTQFFEIKKHRPISGLMDTAREIMREALPIKCLEAVVVGLYLTSGIPSLERFTIRFKTECDGTCHRHIVLGFVHAGRYGAVGLSRRDELMYRPLVFKSLYDMVADFRTAYQRYWHKVLKVKFSIPVVHDLCSCEKIVWSYASADLRKTKDDELKKTCERFSREVKSKTFSTVLPKEEERLKVAPVSPSPTTTRSKAKKMTQNRYKVKI
ncbi:tubulinyl-Tyr carboxypeptidase 1-like [Oscarella lobularis]|uniref:tubulinyl-Tyr carboxypeptidase 1-like n=1 Tax=Oscarella lobularis TaxID=121494 RepID=UPI0033140711